MVVRTTSLNSLKNFLPKIHQPLPLTKRESQQLLESITTSFRKNLDKEHPWELNDESSLKKGPVPQAGNPVLTKSNYTPTLSIPPDASYRQRPIDDHLRTILSNPFFAQQDTKDAKDTQDTNKLPTAETDPFDVFNFAVSRGLMTPRRAVGFLAKIRSQIPAESADDIREGMAKSGAGLRVVQWFRESSSDNGIRFLSNPFICSAIVPFLYAEGLEQVVWTWVAQLSSAIERDGAEGKDQGRQQAALGHLLNAIVKQHSTTYSGLKTSLDGSYEALVHAHDLLPMQNQVALNSFKKIWINLSWASTVFASERPKPSAPPFDSFVDIGRPLRMNLDMAHLELHHPLTPDHVSAVQFMHHNMHSTNLHPTTRRRMVSLALDAADRLKRVGDVDEASWVERFLARIANDLNASLFSVTERKRDFLASESPIGNTL
ncbi:hypothetical protein GGR54DRAFT_90983 [Hypoxylon sp. NC1633]|nr:hypothetical protein GGR54DRAFT_90983 [Hypoxylon sp. NC1633]